MFLEKEDVPPVLYIRENQPVWCENTRNDKAMFFYYDNKNIND